METVRIQNGATEKIVALFYDSSDAVLAGETIPISIYRETDGYWYTGAAWQAGYTTISGDMTEKAQGYYEYDFDTSGLSDDTYHVRAVCSNADCVAPICTGEIKAGYFVDDIDAAISSRSSHGDPDPSGYIDAAISSRSSHAAADVWAVGTRTLTSFGTLVTDMWAAGTRTLTGFGTLAADVWNEAISGSHPAGSAGKRVTDGEWNASEAKDAAEAVEAKLPAGTISDITTAQVNTECDTALTDYNPATHTEMTNEHTTINNNINTMQGKVTDILGDTSEIQGKLPTNNIMGSAVKTDKDDEIDSIISTVEGLNDLSAADVLAQINDALNTAFVDGTTLTANGLKDRLRKLMWILRNKMVVTNTNGNTIIYKDDGITEAINETAALTDDSTTTTRKRLD